ncbi:MAG: hypothetical protein FJ030_06345 [Chloroflexi bacterium]|nr:hypothetical protein [Chloroflexota bacterium]
MKTSRVLLVVILIAALAALACASLPNFTIPSLATATARAALTVTVQAGGPMTFEDGPTVGALDELETALNSDTAFLDSLSKEQYDSAELSQAGETYTHTIDLPEEQPLIWQTNWCTTTEDILNQNLERMGIEFVVNGQTLDPSHIAAFTTRGGDLYCAYFMALVYDWPSGTTTLEIHVTFEEKINDGMADYPKGTHTYQYNVTLP